MSGSRRIPLALLLLLLVVEVLWAWPWSRDMVRQVIIHAQQQVFLPAEGAVSVGKEPSRSRAEAALGLSNPLEASPENLEQGKRLYNTYCYVCHGARGRGDGPVAGGALLPTDLTTPVVQFQSDGSFYNTIRRGYGSMPAYNDRLSPQERWRVILYVRTLGQ